MAKVLHPQIEMSTISKALEIEKYLSTAHEHFGMGKFESLRDIRNVSTYKKLHNKFIEIGLLCDFDLTTVEDVDYVRLSLARAMAYRQGDKTGTIVSIENLPVGPLSAVMFKKNPTLECILSEDIHVDAGDEE